MPTTTKPKAPRKTKAKAAESALVSIKGFNTDMTCRGFQFEPGKTYEMTGKATCCKRGYHACPTDVHPLSVFSFYPPGSSRYFEVAQAGSICRAENDKAASTILTINIEIGIGELVKRAWDFVWSRAIKSDDAHVTIESGAASATGTQGAASATGYQGAASATGDHGAALATGTQGAASATGYQGAASATGYEGRVSGAVGNAIFAVERKDYRESYDIVSVACGIVGQDGIEPGVWYVCRGGKLVAECVA